MKLKQEALASPSLRDIIRCKKFGTFILECLCEETTEESVIEDLRPIFDVPGEEVRAAVADLLLELRKIDALEE